MPTPTVADCETYLSAQNVSWSPEDIASAFAAEFAAQSRVTRHPVTVIEAGNDVTVWPEDLAEALFRRVAHNLALRALPLGVEAAISETTVATTRVGGTDAEVRRLEAPFRRLVLG